MKFFKSKRQLAWFLVYVIEQGDFQDFNVEMFYSYNELSSFIDKLEEDFGDMLTIIQIYKGERKK